MHKDDVHSTFHGYNAPIVVPCHEANPACQGRANFVEEAIHPVLAIIQKIENPTINFPIYSSKDRFSRLESAAGSSGERHTPFSRLISRRVGCRILEWMTSSFDGVVASLIICNPFPNIRFYWVQVTFIWAWLTVIQNSGSNDV